MARSSKQKDAQAAWDRIEAMGGEGIWDSDMVVVSFDGKRITDDDLQVFQTFPYVQILDLSNTKVTDKGLAHLDKLTALESLIVINTKISSKAIKAFEKAHPAVEVQTKKLPKGTVNPLTGEVL